MRIDYHDPGYRTINPAGVAFVTAKLRLLDEHLASRKWMVGDKRTILDAYVTPMPSWAAAS